MKLRLALSALLSLPLLAQAAPATSPLLVIHGGAGVERKDLSPAEEKAAREALRAALLKGHAELAAGARRLQRSLRDHRAGGRSDLQCRQGRGVHS